MIFVILISKYLVSTTSRAINNYHVAYYHDRKFDLQLLGGHGLPCDSLTRGNLPHHMIKIGTILEIGRKNIKNGKLQIELPILTYDHQHLLRNYCVQKTEYTCLYICSAVKQTRKALLCQSSVYPSLCPGMVLGWVIGP